MILIAVLVESFTATAQTSGSPERYYTSGLARFDKKDFDGAIADFDRVLQTLLDGPSRRVARRSDDIVVSYERTIVIIPRAAAAYDGRGLARYAKGDLDEAIADYDQAIGIAPRYAEALNNRGAAWQIKGELEKAVADYTQAIQIDPGNPGAYFNRGLRTTRKENGTKRLLTWTGQSLSIPGTQSLI